jgi:hypothetical protein
MRLNVIFLDGREQETTLPVETPLSLIPTLIADREAGILSIEIISVNQ